MFHFNIWYRFDIFCHLKTADFLILCIANVLKCSWRNKNKICLSLRLACVAFFLSKVCFHGEVKSVSFFLRIIQLHLNYFYHLFAGFLFEQRVLTLGILSNIRVLCFLLWNNYNAHRGKYILDGQSVIHFSRNNVFRHYEPHSQRCAMLEVFYRLIRPSFAARRIGH